MEVSVPERTVLVTGGAGMLAVDVLAAGRAAGLPMVALDRAALDLRDTRLVHEVVAEHRPGVVINCAGWTAVDDAEEHEAEAYEINARAVRTLARECSRAGARLMQVSTDYVFDGRSSLPYSEAAPPAPLNAYGRTKLAGERAALEHDHYVVRTAWLYGAHGGNFVRTMIRMEAERDILQVVDDQRGQPTWTADLAESLIRLARSDRPAGVYHATSAGATTWCGLAKEVFMLHGADPARVRPMPTAELSRPAPRPANSVLANTKTEPMRHWRAALRAAWGVLAA